MTGPVIAVIGIGVRYPHAETVEEFRANLLAGRDSVRPIPTRRVEAAGGRPDRTLPMGWLPDVDLFDHAFFGLSRREAELMDPQHRLACRLTQAALDDAGYAPSLLRSTSTAVIFSTPSPDYQLLVPQRGTLAMTGTWPGGLPARIAHRFGLAGPCYGVDTGCNGSLVAVHHARRELAAGDADYALIGGVNLRTVPPEAGDLAGFPEIMSPAGRCRAFDEAANGTVGGEGGAVLLLTTLDRALAEGARIHALLTGTAVRHNGHHAATISTPSASAQAEVITAAWRNAGLDVADADYVEAHGSGTRLGDAVEVEGLALARAGRAPRLPVGSVKTNIGHLDNAAGVTGLVKTILSVAHGELYPSLHFTRPPREVDLDAADLEVVTSTRPWPQRPDHRPRRAGVSSFSLGGLNAHCVVEQAPSRPAPSPFPPEPVVVGVSARTTAALRRLSARLAGALRGRAASLTDVAFTLNEGRDHHLHRIAVRADTTSQLVEALERCALGELPVPTPAAGPPRLLVSMSGDSALDAPEGAVPALPPELPLTGPVADHIARQLAAYRRLASIVPVDGILASGTSRYLARWLQGDLSAEDTALLATGDAPAPPADPARLTEASRQLVAERATVVVDLGAGGDIGAVLATSGNIPLVTVDRADDVSDAVSLLYQWGVPVTWAALRPAWQPRRVPLPGHPLTEVRCWVGGGATSDVTAPAEEAPGGAPSPGTSTPPPAGSDSGTPAAVTAPEAVPAGAASGGTGPRGTAVVARPTSPSPPDTPVSSHAPGPGGSPAAGTRSAPSPASTSSDQRATAPGDVGEVVREVLGEALGEPDPAPDADFFDLGGNSVIGIQLVNDLNARLAVDLRLIDVYEHRTLPELAAHVTRLVVEREPAVPAGLPPITPATGEPVLSFGQERMWFHHQWDPGTTLYNLGSRMRVRGRFDLEAWRAALNDFAERHQTIRSNFVEDGGGLRVVIRPDLGDFLRLVDLSEDPDAATTARRLAAEHTSRPFDLATDALYRVLVLRFAADDHLVVNSMHHAVNDGHAPTISRNEITELYAARVEGRPHRLPPLPLQYHDYARWQRDLVAGPLLAGQRDFWRRTLADAPVLDLPTDLPRPATTNFRGDYLVTHLPPDLARRVRTTATEAGATPYVVLLAVLNLLLARRGGARDIVIATPSAGRNRPELWSLLGFFNNTLLLRTDLSDDPDLPELVDRVREVVLAAVENEDLPFDAVVREVAPHRDPSRNTLFDVMYTHQVLPELDALQQGDPSITLEYSGDHDFPGMPEGAIVCDLSFATLEHADREEIDLVVAYRTQLFYRSTAQGLAESYLELLAEVLPAGPAHEDATPPRPARQVGGDRPENAAANPPERPDATPVPTSERGGGWFLPDRVAQWARRTPAAAALVHDDIVVDHAELHDRVTRLAHLLVARGVRPEDRVALLVPRGVDLVVGRLATLLAGAVHLPLDPDHPVERRAVVLADAAPVLVVTTGPLATTLPPGAPVLRLDHPDTEAALAGPPDSTLPAHPPSPDAAAYVMYTSGSTGRPKGVVVPHSALATVLRFCQDTRFPRHGRYRVATTASTSFDISWDGPLWLAGGHEVHVIGDTERRDPHALVSYVERHRVDCLNITPTHCRELLAAGLLDPERAYRPRLVVLCGEPVPKPLWTALRRAAPHTEVLNSYGITECGVENLVTPLSDWEEPALGDPAADTGIHLLGGTLEPGDHGELHVTGSCLARGYLGRPALTAQRFVANPFGPPGTRMYRTGDLAVRDHRGRFVSRGRTDGQVKLRGVRIELGEIESALEDHTGVEQAAVVLTRGTHPTLVASVVGTASPEQLRAHLANRLPSAMLPARIQTVDRLPRTVSGKTDRAALAAHEGPGATGDAGRRDEGVPPGPGGTRPGSVQGSTEVPARRPGADHLVGPHVGRADKRPAPSRPDVDELRELFGEMLERGPVRADDDFFDLGGHSLLAARLVRRVSARTGHELPVTTFFDASTPARLAARLAQPARPAERPVVLPLRTGGGTAPLICVHPAGGTGTLYSPLVPHLHRDRPVSALQSRHQGSAVLESTGSLVELAADYRGEIQAHQPHGPYHLLGWSFGGVLAHEIAVQLQREGHQVATLALFDAYPDDGAVPALTTDQLREALRDIRHFAEDELDLVAPVIQHHQAMTRAHTPGVFDGNVLFLHATEERPEGAPHPSVWAPHVSGDLVTHELQCTHQGLTRPDILPRVARLLDGWARSTSGEGSAR